MDLMYRLLDVRYIFEGIYQNTHVCKAKCVNAVLL